MDGKTIDTVRDYYLNTFPPQMRELMDRLYIGLLPGGGKHFHLRQLYRSKAEPFDHIPKEELPLFLVSLACTVLYDQLLYSHFPRQYRTKDMTTYPKITYSLSVCSNIKPWELLDEKVIMPRSISHQEIENTFKNFVEVYAHYMKETITRDFPSLSWSKVKSAMHADSDIYEAVYGRMLMDEIDKT